ncbi:MAG: CRISPR-associated protein Cas4 [Bacteroidota bacterium]
MTGLKNNFSSSHIAYFHLCHRKLWLYANGIRMENATGNLHVAEGKLIGETTYTRRAQKWKELDLGPLKIDHYDPITNTVREVKKSPKLEHAHVAQVKYYLWALQRRGILRARGIIEYPKHRRKTEVVLLKEDLNDINGWEAEIDRIVHLPQCPGLVKKGYCRNCAFRDFCFV